MHTAAHLSMGREGGFLSTADIGPRANPYEQGLGGMVRLDKPSFVGREALVAAPCAAR